MMTAHVINPLSSILIRMKTFEGEKILNSPLVKKLLSFEFIFLFCVFYQYVPQSLLGIYLLGATKQTMFGFFLPAYTIFSFIIIYTLCEKNFKFFDIKRIKIDLSVNFLYLAFLSYLCVVFLLCYTTPSVPLFTSLLGEERIVIYESRVAFDLTREGWEKLLTYLYIIYTAFICPYVIVTLFDRNHRYKWLFLFVFCFTLLLGLAKTIFLLPFVPLTYYYLASKKKNLKTALTMVGLFCICIFLSSFFFFGKPKEFYDYFSAPTSHPDVVKEIKKTEAPIVNQAPIALPTESDTHSIFWFDKLHTNKSFILNPKTSTLFMLNRFLWIPYATMYFYLDFRINKMNDMNVSPTNTIRPLSKLLGTTYLPYDQLVFNHQFEVKDNKFTGVCATPYFVEIYAKYGLWTFIIISLFIPIIFFLVRQTASDILKALFCISLILMTTNPLITVLTNGLLLLIALLFFDITFTGRKR